MCIDTHPVSAQAMVANVRMGSLARDMATLLRRGRGDDSPNARMHKTKWLSLDVQDAMGR